MTDSVDILIKQLYNSNDPLCTEAAVILDTSESCNKTLRYKVDELSKCTKLLMEALMEITEISAARDKPSKKNIERIIDELELRLEECGQVAHDTLRLKTVKNIFEGYFYK